MTDWTFLSNHGQALLSIARDHEIRLRDIAADLGITERRAYDIVTNRHASGIRRASGLTIPFAWISE
jgi:hypothetical protein